MTINRLTLPGLLLAVAAGCSEQPASVIVYCSVDEEFARQVFAKLHEQTGINVQPMFDSEAGKTTGLVNRIRAERDRPRSHVLFSSEIFNTIALADEGLLAPYEPRTASDIPPSFRDKKNQWTAIGLRGRVLAYDPARITADELPERWEQLSEPAFAKRLAFANPMFGTTRGHVAAMFAQWGDVRATKFLTDLRDHGAIMVDGNSSAVRAILNNRVDMCMTDTDDVWVAQKDGATLELKYLDMGNGGTLWIPCTVALIRRPDIPETAKRVVDFLVSAEAERLLANSRSRSDPVRSSLHDPTKPDTFNIPATDYAAVADALDASASAVRDVLLR